MTNTVLRFQVRKLKRLLYRMDSMSANFDVNPKVAYAIAKSLGIDVSGKKPREVWELIKQKGYSPKDALKHINGTSQKKSENGQNGFTKLGNIAVRKWYKKNVSKIMNSIDPNLPLEEKSKQAFAMRNKLRTQAREMMSDTKKKNLLNRERPNLEYEQLIRSKMERKGLTREEAIEDILKTATKTNEKVDKELGIED